MLHRTLFVRRSIATALILALSLAASATFAQHGPYTAYINTDEVYVRSGPGKNYYPTQKLQRGDQVEVYRHDPGGWFAIRPPEGSFSWISGEYVKSEDGQGTVIGDRVVARVGSEFSDVRDVIQVRLHRGEQLQIIGQKEFNPGPAAQTWYKIAPPSGEFRWIHGNFVSEQLDEPQPPLAGARRNLLVPDDQLIDKATRGDDADVALAAHREDVDGIPVPKSNLQSTPAAPAAREESNLAEDRLQQRVESGDLDHEAPPTRVAMREAQRTRQPVLSREERLAVELDAIELQLSAIVVEEPSAWYFEDLFSRANAVLDQGETAIERGRARLVLNKLEKFADIKRRYDALNQITTNTDRANRPYSRSRSASSATRDSYDGVGRLARVQSSRAGVPTYALTDASGAIRYFVTPAPGVNLRHYLGQEVGISGQVGYSTDLEQQHVTARRVTVLEEGVIRR